MPFNPCPTCFSSGPHNHTCSDPFTLEDYLFATYSQTACNLGTLVHSLDTIVTRLQSHIHDTGGCTDDIAGHPIVRLYAEQIHYLSSRLTSWDDANADCNSRCTQPA